jgi:gliding motility associated protien GldN
MKKISVFILVLLASVASYAQHQVNSFFDDLGIVRLETQELEEDSKTIVTVFHRSDDVVWSRVVYRIIDLRFKQNYQLYTPVAFDDPAYSSLFRTMLRGIENGMPIYRKSSSTGDIKPYFNEAEKVTKKEIPSLLKSKDFDFVVADDSTQADISKSNYMLLNYDSVADKLSFQSYSYEDFAKNTIKYMIQEVIFFDKHYSRLYSKIMAIAPMNPDNVPGLKESPSLNEDISVMDALYGQILFWVPFDAFRPYMAKQYVMQSDNDSKRVTFDEFFIKKLYTSYIVGTSNVYDRMIPDYATTPEEIAKEQERVEWELLSAEQDLWEY